MTGARTRVALAQNLFRSDRAARRLVAQIDIRAGEVVYDLGAGTGRVTDALLRVGAQVVAVEQDPNLAHKLRVRFARAPVHVVRADLRQVTFRAPYKVVANLPFNVTAAALRRLLCEDAAPGAAALVLQREAAAKYAGRPRLTVMSLAARPWFEITLAGAIPREDFVPIPQVDVTVLRIVKRPEPLLKEAHRMAWQAFVRYALARPDAEVCATFRPLLSRLQWRRLSADLEIAPGSCREDLTLRQWLGVYRFVRSHIPDRKRRRALGG